MVHRCCIASCKMNIRQAESKGLSYHTFPANQDSRDKWLQAIFPYVESPERFKIVQNYTRICSRHFKPGEYSFDTKKRARLSSTAVPSIFQRKSITTSPIVQNTIEAIKPKKDKLKKAAITLTTSPPIVATQLDLSEQKQVAPLEKLTLTLIKDPEINGKYEKKDEEAQDKPSSPTLFMQTKTSAADQMILNLLKSVSDEITTPINVIPHPSTCHLEHIAVSEANKESLDSQQQALVLQQQLQPQPSPDKGGVRKRRKWNRTAFARSCKSKLKKDNNSSESVGDTNFNESQLSTSVTSLITLQSNSNNELEKDQNVTFKTPSTPVNCSRITTISSEILSSSSSSCLSLNDPAQIATDLSLMSLDQDLLHSIQAVTLDCVESSDINDDKNIHIGDDTGLIPIEDLVSDLLIDSSSHKALDEGNAIILEDALISSATGMSLHSPGAQDDDDFNKLIDNLAYDFSSSLLTTNVSLPEDPTHMNKLTLDCPTFCHQNSINLEFSSDNFISTSEILSKEVPMSGEIEPVKSETIKSSTTNKFLDRFVNKKATSLKKKLVGVSKSTKVRDKRCGVFSVERFRDSDKDIEYYTGFPTYHHFEAFFASMDTYVGNLNRKDIVRGLEDVIKNRKTLQQQQQEQGHDQASVLPPPLLSTSKEGETTKSNTSNEETETLETIEELKKKNRKKIDEVFMTLVRLKRRIPEKVLGDMFLVSQSTVSRVVRTWTMLLSFLLEPISLNFGEKPVSSTTTTVSSPEVLINTGLKTKSCHQSSSSSSSSFSSIKKDEKLFTNNYFTLKNIYIPDAFKNLFKSDLADAIISSTQNSRPVSSNSTSTKFSKSNRNINNNND